MFISDGSDEDAMVDPSGYISFTMIDDLPWNSPLKNLFSSHSNLVLIYDFDRAGYKVIPVLNERRGWGVWTTKPFEYTKRVGILFDKNQLRIYLWKTIIVFGKRDMEILVDGVVSTQENHAVR